MSREVLGGPMVAYVESWSGPPQYGLGGPPDCGTRVYVRDLDSGRLMHDLPSGIKLQPHPSGCEGVGPIEALVTKSDGAVAWIASDWLRRIALGLPYPRYFDLYAAEASGERLVASGTGISPRSLSLAGSTLYWTQEGKPMSATLD